MVRFEESGGEEPVVARDAGLAPVIPLFGGGGAPVRQPPEHERDAALSADTAPVDAAAVKDAAEAVLLRRLRTRQLSVREARGVLRDQGLDADDVDALIEVFLDRGYLDDARLAEQLIHSAVDRKGQGRRAITQSLAKRGIARETADEAVDELPDDDAERALEFARGKARSMGSLDPQVALRRLAGQLARRGYPGGIALEAARRALSEQGGASSVRFR